MQSLNNNTKAFLVLVRAGLWACSDTSLNLDLRSAMSLGSSMNNKVDWDEVYRLATEQSVQGLVLAGVEHSNIKPPQELLLQWIGEVQILEQQNLAMNGFVAKLIDKLRVADVYAILVKGQGVAQCYEHPLWRASGDVDLLLSAVNYEKAKEFLFTLASSIDKENSEVKHFAMMIDGWSVELHGSLRSCLLRKMDKLIDDVQKDVFYRGNVRSWNNGGTTVFLPPPDNDVIFVFTHILKHFFHGGIGLRQICDWCRLLWTYKDSLNHGLLESRIKRAGLMTEWKAFAYYAVNYLGMPVKAMPLFSSEEKWLRKAEKINEFILSVGNFGHNRENIYKESNFVYRKAKAFGRRISDARNHLFIFPIDSMKVFFRMLLYGMIGFAKGI